MACKPCSPGSFCPEGASAELPCPASTYSGSASLARASAREHKNCLGHVGTHPLMMQGFVEQREMQYIYDQLREILPQVLAGGNHVIAFWCNAGEHRSVAVREFVGH